MPPRTKEKGRVANFYHPATSGTQNAGKPKANGGGKMGRSRGLAPWRGAVGGASPQRQKRERVAHISNPATSGTQNAGKPKANGGGKMGGSRGPQAPWRGAVGGAPPQIQKRERVAHISNPATSGTQNAGKPSANGGGQGGPGGASPHGRGSGDVPPEF